MRETTRYFEVPPSVYARAILYRRITLWGVIAGVILAGGLVAAIWDWRWAVVALMLIMVVAPMVVALAYLSAAASRQAVAATRPHCVKIDTDNSCHTVIYESCEPQTMPAIAYRRMGTYILIETAEGITIVPCSILSVEMLAHLESKDRSMVEPV